MAISALYNALFGKKAPTDGSVIDLSEHGRVGGVSTGQPFKFTAIVDPVSGGSPTVSNNRLDTNSFEFYQRVAQGLISGYSLIHKFGEGNVGTSLVPVTSSLTYQTPQTATSLEFVSSSANDTSSGSGAREITIVGLNSNWEEVTQTLVTNGTTPVALGTNLTRLFRWYVSSTGTYATPAAGSHAGTLTIRVAGAGATWDTIVVTPFVLGQSEIGCYTVPLGKTAYLLSKHVTVEGTKPADIYMFQRPNAHDVTSPYSGAMRLIEHEVGVSGSFAVDLRSPNGPFVGPCDIGFMAVVSAGNSNVSVDFELLLVG